MKVGEISALSAFVVFGFASVAVAQSSADDYNKWFAKLVAGHLNRDFCPPPGTTYATLATSIRDYAKAHGFAEQLHDNEFVVIMHDIYPCAGPKALTPAEAEALGAKPLGSVSGNVSVPPVGIFATIDMGPTGRLLNELRQPHRRLEPRQ